MRHLIFHSFLKYLNMILSSFCDMILTRDSIVNLKTIVDHCPQNFENHRKTIDGNGGLKKNINHSIALKNRPSLWSRRHSWSKLTFGELALIVVAIGPLLIGPK